MCLGLTTKRLSWTGQSNVGGVGSTPQSFGAMPANSLSYLDGPGGSSIDEDAPGANVPHYWRSDGAGPPLLAAWLAAAQNTPVNIWIHGEVWFNNPVTDYSAQVAGLISNVGSLSGRNDTLWVLWQLNSLANGGAVFTPANIATLQGYQVAIVAALGSRGILLNTDFVGAPGVDGIHYTIAQRTTLRNATFPLIATRTGDSSWNP